MSRHKLGRINRRIQQHTDSELDMWIEMAADKFGQDFWLMLHGIDAYMEKRRRKEGSGWIRVQQKSAYEDD